MVHPQLAEMISNMAHDLRSPLTSIKGFSGMLVTKWERFDDAQKLEFLEAVHFDATRMARLVGEVIDLARLEIGRLELNRSRTPVAPIAEAARAQLAHLAGASRVELDVPDGVVVFADADRLMNVLVHLLENAIKFSDEDAVNLGAVYDGEHVRITVTDSGAGIDPARFDELFLGPRGPRSKTDGAGAGVGLYLSRSIVELHGGAIEVESAPGRGSTFTVTLPPSEESHA